MAIDIEEFKELFGIENTTLEKVQKIFPGAEEIKLEQRTLTWKGKSTTVYDYELFVMTIKDWIKRNKWTKEQALDEWFSMV